MSLAARHLEALGIATLCLGSALDILQAGAPPRAAFLDYPLGHGGGRPFDRDNQYAVLRSALEAFERISAAGEILALPFVWDSERNWKDRAMPVDSGDTRMPRDTSPQYQSDDDRRLAENPATALP